MHAEDLGRWTHSHRFETGGEERAERRTRIVVGLTLVVMLVEIAAGTAFNSMALLADGWHMATHVGALGIAAFAYAYARRHADNPRFAFGTGKVGSLAAFASAVALAMVAALLIWESGNRLLAVQTIRFDEALPVAVLGLLTNVASIFILGGHGHDHHDHDHAHDDHAHHHDHNLRAAYLHVMADALTSVTAIAALLLGKFLGWWWVDPLMGILGAAVILVWAWNLMRQSGRTLVDMSDDDGLRQEVTEAIEGDADNKVTDLHLWRVGPGHWAAIVSVVTHEPRDVTHYRTLLAPVHELSHITVEVLHCPD